MLSFRISELRGRFKIVCCVSYNPAVKEVAGVWGPIRALPHIGAYFVMSVVGGKCEVYLLVGSINFTHIIII